MAFRGEEKLWARVRGKSKRADSLYLHQEDAVEAGRSRANFEKVKLIIHKKDGSLRK